VGKTRLRRAAALSASLLLGRGPAMADVVTSPSVQFDFEITEDQVAKSCHLLVLIVNYPNPEAVNFKVLFTFGKGTHQAFCGFIADAGDVQYQNGNFAGLKKVPLAEAEFSSSTFESAGRFHMNAAEDGGVFGSTGDLPNAAAYLRAVVIGDFSITIRRSNAFGYRTYLIKGLELTPLDRTRDGLGKNVLAG
jgi:hypothetical protein